MPSYANKYLMKNLGSCAIVTAVVIVSEFLYESDTANS